ncbi:MAG: transketolase [bacterium]|nr:transketolase [bacterium]
MNSRLDDLCINTLRTLAMDAVQKANSGHPGLPMGAAAMAYAVWTRHLRHDPADPKWINRDRFVLSAGHGCMLLYSLLHVSGYDVSLDDLKNFRQWGSITPGHPESHLTPGVEATTGPLGQGIGNIVGMAIAREHLAARFNSPQRELINFRAFGLCSDGDLMEGVASEACSLAGHLGLGAITLLYDDNRITIDGHTELAFTENVAGRFEAYGWQVLRADGMNAEEVDAAVREGLAETERPTLIICRTTIGFGSPNKADKSAVHGSPLGEEEVARTKRALGWPEDRAFYIPNEAFKHFRAAAAKGAARAAEWKQTLQSALAESEEFRREWNAFWNREIPANWMETLPSWDGAKPVATRKISQQVLQAISAATKNLLGGSADLAESNLTYLDGAGDFQKQNRRGRNLRFGIREHAMGAIANGLAHAAPFIPFASTFLTFSDYMRPAIRVAALAHLPVIYVFTHDSIGLGEDGPTHQPVEQLWSLRAMPNLFVFRPADAHETALCWKLALERTDGPSALALTRQNLPVLDRRAHLPMQVERGAYVLKESSSAIPQVILLAAGSEVSLALNAREILERDGLGVRVVSVPCVELFDAQPLAYRQSVLPDDIGNRIAIEAGASCGWWKYVGSRGDVVGLDRFGASAPADLLFKTFGLTAEHVAERTRALAVRNRT